MNFHLQITIADPAGNRTAFAEGNLPPEHYAAVGNALMSEKELNIEQVGFVCPPLSGSIGRLEMMGGEFCGNAARSFGLWMGTLAGKKTGESVPVEISGSTSVLNVLLEETGSWISMPLPEKITELQVPDGNGNPLLFPVVILEGITHVILENIEPSETLARAVIKEAAKISHADAAGAIFLNSDHMTPAVWVRATDSFIWESSCGSGTLAATIWLGRSVTNGEFSKKLIQPGGVLEAGFTAKYGAIVEARLGGPVIIENPIIRDILV